MNKIEAHDADVLLSQSISEVYAKTGGVQEAKEKRQEKKSWGTSVDGVVGRAEAPIEKRRTLSLVMFAIVLSG